MTGFLTSCSVSDNAFNDENVDEIVLYIMIDRFGMEFGAGVTAEVNDNVELSLGYEGKFREDYQDHTGLINAKYKF